MIGGTTPPALLVRDGFLYRADDDGSVHPEGSVLAVDGRVVAAGDTADVLAAVDEIEPLVRAGLVTIDAGGALILPGFVNPHWHDMFAAMIEHQLRALGLRVTLVPYHRPFRVEDHDLVLMGPGPGDPGDSADPKIAVLRRTMLRLLEEERPFLAVCLSHQVLGSLLGVPIVRRSKPNQGIQVLVDLFGRSERVGFYNTFAVVSEDDVMIRDRRSARVQVARDPTTGEVHALRGERFASVQFHAESILTQDGLGVLSRLLTTISLPRRAGAAARPAALTETRAS